MAITFYATNNFTGDGTTVNWNINFADGYIDTTNVRARYLDNTGSYVDIAISSVAGNVVTISPAVANGQEFQIYRDTEKRFPLVDFSDGAILNETNLDTLATQAVMVSAEAFDQSNNGVRIAGDSLVIAQGIDAKAQLALDTSDAAVATANAIDGKAQTALDSSAAAVVTANAAASTAAGAANTANTALATANDAAADAATAITTANGAVTTANVATTTANAASSAAAAATTTANNAANDAAAAVSTAGTALSTANTASTNASAAVSTANDAKTTAEGIEAKADSALAASANAVATANAAEATANAIDGKATDALNTADAAEATANAAAATASSAATDASTALSTVNAADAKAQTALDNIVTLDAATMKKAANLSDIADKAAARTNLGLGPLATLNTVPVANGGTGATDVETARANLGVSYGNTSNTVTQGNDPRLGTLNGKTGGNVSSSITVTSGYITTASGEGVTSSGGSKTAYLDAQGESDGVPDSVACSIGARYYSASFSFGVVRDGSVGSSRTLMTVSNGYGTTGFFDFLADSTASCTQWISTSDPRVKSDINVVDEPLIKMRKMHGYTWKYLTSENLYGRGFLSTELAEVFPDAVSTTGRSVKLTDGTTVDNVQGVDLSGATAALHHEAILALMDKVEALEARIAELTSQ